MPAKPFLLARKGFICLAAFGGVALLSLSVLAQDDNTPRNDAGNGSTGTGFFNYQNAPINNILDNYEQLTGKHLVRDASLSTLPPISINASGLNKADTLKLIEATLLLNGVAFVPLDENTIKVMVAPSKNPRSEGVKLYANAADLPTTEQVVSYYMPFDYISAQEAQTIFSAQSTPHTYGAYVVAPTAQALILTENVSVIRQLIALKELVDVPPAHVTSEFIQLTRADAEKVSDTLKDILNPKKEGTAPGGGQSGGSAMVPAALGTDEPLSNEQNLISGPAQIIPDLRSNRLLIVTRPVNMPFLRQLIAELDKADESMLPQRRVLKYVLAGDILPALEAALAQGKDEETQAKQDQSTAASHANNQTSPTSSPAVQPPTNTGTGSNSVATSVQPLQAPVENDVPTFVTVGRTRLLADNRSNSIIVFGPPDASARVFEIIDELDHKPLQVYLATVIGQLTLTNDQEFGVDLLQKFQGIGQGGLATSQFTRSSSTASGATSTGVVPEPKTLISSTLFPLTSGLTLYGAIGSTLDAYVQALETTNHFKVISRPSIYTANNKHALIATGSEVPIPSNTVSGFTGSNNQLTTSSSIQYQQVLLQLDVVPLINANHQVTLQIQQTNNSLGSSQNIGGNEVPTILTQVLNTSITVNDKSTIVIGGLISDSKQTGTTGVPFLSDIPLLGYLFKDTTKDKERDELIIMIQPTVIESDEDQIAANEEEKQRTILIREAPSGSLDKALSPATPDSQVKSPPGTVNASVPTAASTQTQLQTTTPSPVLPSP